MSGIFAELLTAELTRRAADAQAETILIGGQIESRGRLLSASAFRQSAKSVREATNFNLQVDNINTQRRLRAQSRQYQRLLGQQLSQQTRTNVSVTSKSFLMLRNETSDLMTRNLVNTKVDAENIRRSKTFESQIKQTELENRARIEEFSAAAARTMAANRAREARFQGEIAAARVGGTAILDTLFRK